MPILADLVGKPKAAKQNEDAAKAAFAEYERIERSNWAKRFEGARSNIPPKFSWIEPLRLRTANPVEFRPLLQEWHDRLPWLTVAHVAKLWAHWQSRTNLLICGPPDVGKTCIMILHAQWTLALAGYDAKEVRDARATVANFAALPTVERKNKEAIEDDCEFANSPIICSKSEHADKHYYQRIDQGHPPPEPEWLPQVKEAQYLRFVSAPGLLDERQQGPDEAKLRDALKSSALYLDEVGREMYGAKGAGHLASGRRAVMMRVLQSRWENERRFVATTEHTIGELSEMYGVGSFRRIAGERSGSIVIDLADDEWAGAWIRQQERAGKR